MIKKICIFEDTIHHTIIGTCKCNVSIDLIWNIFYLYHFSIQLRMFYGNTQKLSRHGHTLVSAT
jgi:hypothetical protein